MVKHRAIIFITTIYLLSCLGISVNGLCCCAALHSTSALQGSKTTCKRAPKMHGCCKTKKQYLKVKDQHVGVDALTLNFSSFHTIIRDKFTPDLIAPVYTARSSFNSNAPPGWHKTPDYILNCTYRI
jgi:hypothetical protein